jgi:hypothetical protein
MPANARSRIPIATSPTAKPMDRGTRTTPTASAIPVHRGSTRARATAYPKPMPAITITAPWIVIAGSSAAPGCSKSLVPLTSAYTTVPVKNTKLYA